MTDKQENKLTNVMTLSIDRAVKHLSEGYTALVKSGRPFSDMPSVMLWGPPGVGKSQGVKQMAAAVAAATGKRAVVTDVRLLLFNPVDLRGIPTSNEDKTLAVWLKPKIFAMDESDDVINFLFLDELSAAPQSVQAAAYQITLDRKVGEHELPKNCIVLAAGNRVSDKSVANRMPKALANRLCHFDIEMSAESWKKWAYTHGVHPTVIGFLSFRPERLMMFSASNDDIAFATPRSWEMVSNIVGLCGDADGAFSLIAGCVGVSVAAEYRAYAKLYSRLPAMEDIFSGKSCPVPTQTDELFALITSMVCYAVKCKDFVKVAYSVSYGSRLPVDFSMALFKQYLAIDDNFRFELLKISAFTTWMSRHGGSLN